jgi:hypothetical protein
VGGRKHGNRSAAPSVPRTKVPPNLIERFLS